MVHINQNKESKVKLEFNAEQKRLTISECEFEAVEIQKNGIQVADIPILNGTGFITNTDDIQLNDEITLHPYNTFETVVSNLVQL